MSDQYLFVYGTLRRDGDEEMHGFLASYAEFVGRGSVAGRLYEVAGYPGAVLGGGPDDRVYGEVFRLRAPEGVLWVLDEYEGCSPDFAPPHEYRRIKVSVNMEEGHALEAWFYEYNHDVDGLRRIGSGDYVAFLARGAGSDPAPG